MKKLLALLLVVTATNSFSFAQKIDIADRTNVWYVLHNLHLVNPHRSGNKTVIYRCDTALVVKNGKAYTKIGGGLLLRTDTIDNKVYYYRVFDSSEHVFFDYNVKAGDTFMLDRMSQGAPDTTYFFVSSVDSVYINNLPHKRFQFGGPSYSFLEGIGYNTYADPFFELDPTSFYTYNLTTTSCGLTCFGNKGTFPTLSPGVPTTIGVFDNINSCKDSMLSVTSASQNNATAAISPQPAFAVATIKLSQIVHEGSIVITNTIGQIVLQNQFKEKQELQVENPGQSGVYFYRITDNKENQSYTGKIIFQ